MSYKKIFIAVVVLSSSSTLVLAKRHALIRKAERVELRKKVIKTSDGNLKSLLSKQTKSMSFDEAVQAKEYYQKEHDSDMIIKCGQRLLAVGGDQEIMRDTRLELAQICLDKEKYTDSEKYAQEYQKYYPGAEEAIKAHYVEISANYRAKLTSDRDQQKTLAAIQLSEDFLSKHKNDTEYRPRVKEMLQESYQTLIRSEINIINTQLNAFNNTNNKDALAAAQKRLSFLKEKYAKHAPSTHKRIKELELTLAQADKPASAVKKAKKQNLKVAFNKERPRRTNAWKTIKSAFTEDNTQYFA